MNQGEWNDEEVRTAEVKAVRTFDVALVDLKGDFFFCLRINGEVFAFPDDLARKLHLSVPVAYEVLAKDRTKGAK
jgi:hypothetical protein